jgi:hypothetical protein
MGWWEREKNTRSHIGAEIAWFSDVATVAAPAFTCFPFVALDDPSGSEQARASPEKAVVKLRLLT